MDSYGLQLLSTAGPEPISLAQAQLHCRSDQSENDPELALLIKAVRKYFEKWTNQSFTTQTYQLTLDHFPNYMGLALSDYNRLWDLVGIRLPKSPPIPQGQVTVQSITYVDTTGTPQTMDPTTYNVDLTTVPVRITPAYGKIWPIARYQAGAVQIQFQVIPVVDEDVLAGMLLLLGHWNEHREGVLAGTYAEVPHGICSILALNSDWQYGSKAG